MNTKEFIRIVYAEKCVIDGEEHIRMHIRVNEEKKNYLMQYCKEHKAEILAELDRQEQLLEDEKELETSVSGYYRLLDENFVRKADELFNTMSERQKAFIVAKQYVCSSAYNMNRYGTEALYKIIALKDGTPEQYLAIVEELEKNYEESLIHIRDKKAAE